MPPTDYAVISLAEHPEIAQRCCANRLLVEAVEMVDNAVLVSVAREWSEVDGQYVVPQGAWIHWNAVPVEHRKTLEQLFVKARQQTAGPDYHDARNGWRNAKPASEPLRPCAPVRYKAGGRTW